MFGKVLLSGGSCRDARAERGREASRKELAACGSSRQGCWQNPRGSLHPAEKRLHVTRTVEKRGHQLHRVEGRRERRSGNLRHVCWFITKAISQFLSGILV